MSQDQCLHKLVCMYKMDAPKLAQTIMQDIYKTTGITSSAGVGTNLYLAKIAMDIVAKHSKNHIGILDEETYCKTMWHHKPLKDFWRVGPGTVRTLARNGMETMYDVAHADIKLLYHLFGIDAELLIDHAWGRESTTIADIKAYKPHSNGMSNGQVLPRDYGHEEGALVIREMADQLSLELAGKRKVTESITIYLGYSNSYHTEGERGTAKLSVATNSARIIVPVVEQLYYRIKDPTMDVRRMYVVFNNITDDNYIQYDLFTKPEEMERDTKVQQAMISIKERFGKNAVLKGMNLEEGGTTIERNNQIGGHKA